MADYKPSFKILMTADTVGGVWTYCMELCHALQPHDVQVYLVTMGAKMNSWQKEEVSAFDHVIVYETDSCLEWMDNPWNDIRDCGRRLTQLEEKINPDLIHLNCFAYGSLPFSAPVIMVAHSDVYSWYTAVKNDDPPLEWTRYYHCVKEGLNGADLVVAPSHAMMNELRNIYSLTSDTCVIYNGRNEQLFYPGKKQPSVFSMGRLWDESKNIRLVVKASALIDVPVRIAGDNSFEQNHFGCDDNVTYLGKLSSKEVAEELSLAAVFVLPAKYEPFGLSALEAAMSGCAVVLGDIPSLKEIWEDAAIYVDTNNAEALAGTINELIADEERLAFYQSRALSRARKFTSEAMGDEYLQLYEQLLQQKKYFLKQEAV